MFPAQLQNTGPLSSADCAGDPLNVLCPKTSRSSKLSSGMIAAKPFTATKPKHESNPKLDKLSSYAHKVRPAH